MQQRKRVGYTRDRLGCWTCRLRKKRCDGSKTLDSICQACARLNLLCRWETPRDMSRQTDDGISQVAIIRQEEQIDIAAMPQVQLDVLPLDILQGISDTYHLFNDQVGTQHLATSRRMMLRYYTTSFVFMLTTNLRNNCFLSIFLPMAFECSVLMRAIVAWAAAHLAIHEPSFSDLALRHRGSALSNFKVAMEEESISSEMCLAVTMVFCSMESISEGTGAWFQHLLGGVAALRGTNNQDPYQSQSLNSNEGRWLLSNLAYHDALMSVSMDRRPCLSSDYSRLREDTPPDPYFGVGATLVRLIAETSHLKADVVATSGNHATSCNDYLGEGLAAGTESALRLGLLTSHSASSGDSAIEALIGRTRELETQLLQWKCPLDHEHDALGQLAEAYRSGALLHLYRTVERALPFAIVGIPDKIQDAVQKTCDTASKMPDGSLAECTMLFPLFMAGGEARHDTHINLIRERIIVTNQVRQFRNINRCLEVLEEVWRARSEAHSVSDTVVDWLDVVTQRHWELALS